MMQGVGDNIGKGFTFLLCLAGGLAVLLFLALLGLAYNLFAG